MIFFFRASNLGAFFLSLVCFLFKCSAGGVNITIVGQNFAKPFDAQIQGVPCIPPVILLNSTHIRCMIPAGAGLNRAVTGLSVFQPLYSLSLIVFVFS
jgi:hypothetical protein